MKAMMPEIFTGWDPMKSINQLALGYGIFLPLPGYDTLGRKVMIYRMGCFPTDKITAEELEKASGMVSETMGLEGILSWQIFIREFNRMRFFFK